MPATALIAEDEPLLAAELRAALLHAWPELQVVATVGDGLQAVDAALRLQPQVCFLDVRMPGQTGLQAAEAMAEDWPDELPLPLFVFVTAYDHYALQAFEHAAVDYLLKPLQAERLARCCVLLRERLRERTPPLPATQSGPTSRAVSGSMDATQALPEPTLHTLATLLQRLGRDDAARSAQASAGQLRVLQVAIGQQIMMVPVADVLMFEAADKYIRVLTATKEHLIRLSLRELLPQLDPDVFWQVHRGTVVRCDAIERATRDDNGKLTLTIRGLAERPVVSRLHAQRFKGM